MRINISKLNQIIKEETEKFLAEVNPVNAMLEGIGLVDPPLTAYQEWEAGAGPQWPVDPTGPPKTNQDKQPGIDEWWFGEDGKERHLSDPYWPELWRAGKAFPWDVERARLKQIKDDRAVIAMQDAAVKFQNMRDEFGVQPSEPALRSVPDAGWNRLLKQPAEDLPFYERWPADQVTVDPFLQP